jgi:DNA repair exonuclease SbcCD ATPase subunit
VEVPVAARLAEAKAQRRLKFALEQRDALEEQLAAAEERQQALLREQKEKAKLVKEAAHYRNEMELRLATLEKSLFDARKEKKATELSAEKAQAQGRADREVLVECVRQMASQLATARAAAEAANAQLLNSADEATRRVRAAEAIVGSESHELSRLRAQLGECERQLHNEVENRHGSDLAHEAQVLRAAHREEELERQLKAAESHAASQETNLEAARREAEAQLAATRQSERAREEAATLARMELSELQSELRLAERQAELAQQRRAEAEAVQGRIEAAIVRLEAEAVERSSQLAQLAHEHGSLHRAHTTQADASARGRAPLADALAREAPRAGGARSVERRASGQSGELRCASGGGIW